jgi:hypothetical protein
LENTEKYKLHQDQQQASRKRKCSYDATCHQQRGKEDASMCFCATTFQHFIHRSSQNQFKPHTHTPTNTNKTATHLSPMQVSPKVHRRCRRTW